MEYKDKGVCIVKLYRFINKTDKAINFDGVWYPLKLLWNLKEHKKNFSATMPIWLAKKKGLKYTEIIKEPKELNLNDAVPTNELQDI